MQKKTHKLRFICCCTTQVPKLRRKNHQFQSESDFDGKKATDGTKHEI